MKKILIHLLGAVLLAPAWGCAGYATVRPEGSVYIGPRPYAYRPHYYRPAPSVVLVRPRPHVYRAPRYYAPHRYPAPNSYRRTYRRW